MTRTRKAVLAAGVAAAVAGSVATAWATSPNATATFTDNVLTSATSHSLPTTGGAKVTVLTATLPAGKWVLSAAGNLVDFGPSDYTRCRILVGATQVAGVSTIVGNPNTAGNNGPAGFLSPFALNGAVALTAARVVSLQCWHDSTLSSPGYVDAGSSLVIHKTTSLQIVRQ